MTYGPFCPGVPDTERIAELRSLAMAVSIFIGSAHPAIARLRAAETCRPDAVSDALNAIEALPSLTRRKVLAQFSRLTWGPEVRS